MFSGDLVSRMPARVVRVAFNYGFVASFLVLLLFLSAPPAFAQPHIQGQWQTLTAQMPINPVHAALTRDGKVLVIAGTGNGSSSIPQWTTFDPVGQTVAAPQTLAYDMFCNGMVVMNDGRPVVGGGTFGSNGSSPLGWSKTSAYDPTTGQFTQLPSMAHGRWYPSATAMVFGSVLIFSGLDENGNTNNTNETFSPGASGWTSTNGMVTTPPLYPRIHTLPSGWVFYSGPTTGSALLNTTTSIYTWVANVATTNYPGQRTYGTSVLLPMSAASGYKPKVMILGGNSPATNTTEIIDLTGCGLCGPSTGLHWVWGPNMSQPRIELDATILPSGRVLVYGGSTNDEDVTTASLQADLYDPIANTFSSAGTNGFPRLYHSTGLLLPDATVVVMGGNPNPPNFEPHIEIYKPAYLFNSNDTLATRPVITSAPATISFGSGFQIQTPNASTISSVVLVRPGTVTHAFNMDQRMVSLSFTAGSGVLNVTAPPDFDANFNTFVPAPMGYYMLFIVNSSGVPSLAKFVQLGF